MLIPLTTTNFYLSGSRHFVHRTAMIRKATTASREARSAVCPQDIYSAGSEARIEGGMSHGQETSAEVTAGAGVRQKRASVCAFAELPGACRAAG